MMKRAFSSKKFEILPPEGAPALEKLTSKYFPKRLELLFRSVFAFPKDSKSGFDKKMIFLISSTSLDMSAPPLPDTAAI